MSETTWKQLERECLRELALFIRQKCVEFKGKLPPSQSLGIAPIWNECFVRVLEAQEQRRSGGKLDPVHRQAAASMSLRAQTACEREMRTRGGLCDAPAEGIKRIFCEFIWQQAVDTHRGAVEHAFAGEGLAGDALTACCQETWRRTWERLLAGKGAAREEILATAAAARIDFARNHPPASGATATAEPSGATGADGVTAAARSTVASLKPRERTIFLAIHADDTPAAAVAAAFNTSEANILRIASRVFRRMVVACANAVGCDNPETFLRSLAGGGAAPPQPEDAPLDNGADGGR